MPPTNHAAWLPSKSARQLQPGPAPYTPPGPGQIVLKNGAVAINRVDWAKQLAGGLALSYIRYPSVLGGDVAGTVVEVGPDVQRFRVGARVLANAAALVPASNDPAEGGFQQFTVIREHLAAPLLTPSHTSKDACYHCACRRQHTGFSTRTFSHSTCASVPPRPTVKDVAGRPGQCLSRPARPVSEAAPCSWLWLPATRCSRRLRHTTLAT